MLLGNMLQVKMLENTPFQMTDGLKERKANSAAALQELQAKFEKKTVDVSSDDEEVHEVIPPHIILSIVTRS
jgi:hypothetical protein